MIVEYYTKTSYGKTRKYIKNPLIASTLEKITKKTTVTDQDVKNLTILGLEFKEVLPPQTKPIIPSTNL